MLKELPNQFPSVRIQDVAPQNADISDPYRFLREPPCVVGIGNQEIIVALDLQESIPAYQQIAESIDVFHGCDEKKIEQLVNRFYNLRRPEKKAACSHLASFYARHFPNAPLSELSFVMPVILQNHLANLKKFGLHLPEHIQKLQQEEQKKRDYMCLEMVTEQSGPYSLFINTDHSDQAVSKVHFLRMGKGKEGKLYSFMISLFIDHSNYDVVIPILSDKLLSDADVNIIMENALPSKFSDILAKCKVSNKQTKDSITPTAVDIFDVEEFLYRVAAYMPTIVGDAVPNYRHLIGSTAY